MSRECMPEVTTLHLAVCVMGCTCCPGERPLRSYNVDYLHFTGIADGSVFIWLDRHCMQFSLVWKHVQPNVSYSRRTLTADVGNAFSRLMYIFARMNSAEE